MIVVVDSTPLIALSTVNRLDLLHSLYGRIIIPTAVYQETVTQGQGRPGALEVTSADWIETRALLNAVPVQPSLGQGEAETILLAQELSADLVIMDDSAARRELSRRGITLIGSVGVLQQAKLQGLVPALKPELDALRHRGFHLSNHVYQACLRSVGE